MMNELLKLQGCLSPVLLPAVVERQRKGAREATATAVAVAIPVANPLRRGRI